MSFVSVIIPAYNSARTIRGAIESVLVQRFSDSEIIIVDDASRDDTVNVVNSYQLTPYTHAPILISLPRNAGPAAVRNRGIAEAKGEWIAFLDADDAWLPCRLEMQMEYVKQNPDVAMVCGETLPFKDGSSVASPSSATEEEWLVGGLALPADLSADVLSGRASVPASRSLPPDACRLSLDDFVTANPVATSTVLVRKDVLSVVGGFDEQFRGPEDYDLWMRIAARFRVMKSEAVLAYYRYTPGSLSMDDRRFLPMVLNVLGKAFGPGGVFSAMNDLYSSAVSNQYWNASWMAFCRGARFTAVRYWLISYLQNIRAVKRVERKWYPLLFRYVFGPVNAGRM